MPAWLKYKGWRFHVYKGDTTPRPHVHIQKGKHELVVWLETIEVKANNRVSKKDENMLLKKVREEQENFLEKWHELLG